VVDCHHAKAWVFNLTVNELGQITLDLVTNSVGTFKIACHM
jgi:hypothetical protein